MRFYPAILALIFLMGWAAAADSTVSPRDAKDGQSWGASNSGQDMLQMTHDPGIVSKDEGRDPQQAQVANICTTVNGEFYREGEQGYDACMAEKRKASATKTSAAPAVTQTKDSGQSKAF